MLSFMEFKEEVRYYLLTDLQELNLYKSYLKIARKYEKVRLEYDVDEFFTSFDNATDAFIDFGFKEKEIMDFLTNNLEYLQCDVKTKLLVIDTVDIKDRNEVLYSGTKNLSMPLKTLYAKTRLYRELNPDFTYNEFLSMSREEIEKKYNLKFTDVLKKYKVTKNNRNLLASRKQIKDRCIEELNGSNKVKSLTR